MLHMITKYICVKTLDGPDIRPFLYFFCRIWVLFLGSDPFFLIGLSGSISNKIWNFVTFPYNFFYFACPGSIIHFFIVSKLQILTRLLWPTVTYIFYYFFFVACFIPGIHINILQSYLFSLSLSGVNSVGGGGVKGKCPLKIFWTNATASPSPRKKKILRRGKLDEKKEWRLKFWGKKHTKKIRTPFPAPKPDVLVHPCSLSTYIDYTILKTEENLSYSSLVKTH